MGGGGEESNKSLHIKGPRSRNKLKVFGQLEWTKCSLDKLTINISFSFLTYLKATFESLASQNKIKKMMILKFVIFQLYSLTQEKELFLLYCILLKQKNKLEK